jgi:hypothetical protein
MHDRKPLLGVGYYRLKQVDYSGAITYSPVLAVKFTPVNTGLAVYPNPAANNIQVDFSGSVDSPEVQLQVINAFGKVVHRQIQAASTVYNSVSLPLSHLPAGTYYLVVVKNGKKESKAFVKI